MSVTVDDLAVRILAHADDAVVRLQSAIFGGRTAGNDLLYDRFAFRSFQRRADPFEIEPHLDLEVLQRVCADM